MYFKLFKLHSRVKRSVAQPQTIYSEFPLCTPFYRAEACLRISGDKPPPCAGF